jgi:hypothetical protein
MIKFESNWKSAQHGGKKTQAFFLWLTKISTNAIKTSKENILTLIEVYRYIFPYMGNLLRNKFQLTPTKNIMLNFDITYMCQRTYFGGYYVKEHSFFLHYYYLIFLYGHIFKPT